MTFAFGSRTYLMGVLNVTPDSFSDGGRFDCLETAVAQAQRMATAGADILDIGGQSTRPGAETVPLEEELRRVVPVVQALRTGEGFSLPISVDTTRVVVAEAALEAGANWLNDVSGGTYEPAMLDLAAQWQVPIVLMHLRGTPQTMQALTEYGDLVSEVAAMLGAIAQGARQRGLAPQNIILDPGIGFAKTPQQSLELLRRLPELKDLGYPLLIGPSRKSFIGQILEQPDPQQRVWGTAAACCRAIAGGADILRVHDVAEMRDVSRMADALWR